MDTLLRLAFAGSLKPEVALMLGLVHALMELQNPLLCTVLTRLAVCSHMFLSSMVCFCLNSFTPLMWSFSRSHLGSNFCHQRSSPFQLAPTRRYGAHPGCHWRAPSQRLLEFCHLTVPGALGRTAGCHSQYLGRKMGWWCSGVGKCPHLSIVWRLPPQWLGDIRGRHLPLISSFIVVIPSSNQTWQWQIPTHRLFSQLCTSI